jgi:putative peptidoglycan lipid II flippase
MLMRAYQAMKDTRTMFGMYVLENGINVIVAVAVFRRFGVVGLAAAWSIAYTVSAVVAFGHLRSRTSSRDGRAVLATMMRTGAAATLMGVVVILARRLLGEGVVGLGVAVAAGATVYLGAARLLGVGELEPLLGIWRRWS